MSWQLREPALAGVLSALSFGGWPDQFGGDAQLVPEPQTLDEARASVGWTKQQHDLLHPHAEALFLAYRRGAAAVLALTGILAAVLMVRRLKRRRAATPLADRLHRQP